jgi:outer membrane protein TolC
MMGRESVAAMRAHGDQSQMPSALSPATGDIRQVGATQVDVPRLPEPELLPAPGKSPAPTSAPADEPVAASSEPGAKIIEAAPHSLLIGLDTVLRLAEDQNSQVAIARARVQEAFAEKCVARAKWLPDIYVGTAYYRHEGGIQNEDGTLTHSSTGAMFAGLEIDGQFDIHEVAYQQVSAKRKLWQQKGELSRISSETLLDASTTYIDFLAAKTGEAIARDLEAKLTDLLSLAQKLASQEPAANVQVARIQSELSGQQQALAKLHYQAAGAQAKLLYLLNLDPSTELTPIDARLVAFDVADASPPTLALVNQALSTGPGIQEMEGLLAVIQDSIERSKGAIKYAPIFEVRMAEGALGAAPGDALNWDNRWDLGLQARWNLTGAFSVKDRQRVARAKIQQAHLAYQDLRGKLAAGVEEARETIVNGREQISDTQTQVENASRAYDLSYRRLREVFQPTSYTESLLALDSLARAQLNYVTATSAYDKAQLRLMILLGQPCPALAKPAH